MIDKMKTPGWTWVVFAAIVLLLVGVFMRIQSDGVSRFIVLGSQFVDSARLPVPLRVYPGSGYDGQFYFRMALDPFHIERAGSGISLDRLDWRWQRILYPLLCHMLSLGRPEWTAWAMVAVNGLLMIGVIWLISVFTHFRAKPVMMSMVLSGLWMSFARSGVEITAVFFLLLCWRFYDRGSIFFAFLCGMAAVLAKETALVGVMAVALWEFILCVHARWRCGKIRMIALWAPAGMVLLWKMYLYHVTNATGVAGSTDFAYPFFGILQSMTMRVTQSPILHIALWSVGAAWMMAFAGCGIRAMMLHRGCAGEAGLRALGCSGCWGLAAFYGLPTPSTGKMISSEKDPVMFFASVTFMIWVLGLMFFSKAIWEDIWGFLRVTVDYQVCGVLLLGRNDMNIQRFCLYASIGMGLVSYLIICFRI